MAKRNPQARVGIVGKCEMQFTRTTSDGKDSVTLCCDRVAGAVYARAFFDCKSADDCGEILTMSAGPFDSYGEAFLQNVKCLTYWLDDYSPKAHWCLNGKAMLKEKAK